MTDCCIEFTNDACTLTFQLCCSGPQGPQGPAGETNDGANVGAGEGQIYRGKTGETLDFKTLKQGSGVVITNGADEIQIDATGAGGGEANEAINAGTGVGSVGLPLAKVGVDLPFKGVAPGSAKVTITDNAINNDVDIDVDENQFVHMGRTDNPHGVTAAQAGADPTGSAAAVQTNLDAHEADLTNPHSVTAVQAGADPAGSAAAVQTNLDAHEADLTNPHAVTAAQSGADPAGSANAVQINLNAHVANVSNPHSVTAAQAGADPVGSAAAVQTNLNAHTANLSNPHAVTAVQAGADPVGSAAAVQTNLNAHTGDSSIHVTANQSAALDAANLPSGTNPIATQNDLGGFVVAGGTVGQYYRKQSGTDFDALFEDLKIQDDGVPILGGDLQTNNQAIVIQDGTPAEQGLILALTGGGSAFGFRADTATPFDPATDSGIAVGPGETHIYGTEIQIPSLIDPNTEQQVYISTDGVLYGVEPPAPGWEVTDTDNADYQFSVLGSWVEIVGLVISLPQDVNAGDRIDFLANLYIQNFSATRSGTLDIGFGIDGVSPATFFQNVLIQGGFDAVVPVAFSSTTHGGLTTGQTVSVFVRRATQEHAQFDPWLMGSLDPSELVVSVPSQGGSGQNNAGENIGTGEGEIYAGMSGANLQIKTLLAGSGVTITNLANEVQIDATGAGGGEQNTTTNEGVGGVGLALPKSGVNLPFKNINAASNKVTVVDDPVNNEVDIGVNENNFVHMGRTDNPHGVTAVQAGADPAGSASAVQTNLDGHVANTSNPHSVTAAQAGADPAGSAAAVQTNLTNHENNTSNPHSVTATQVGATPEAPFDNEYYSRRNQAWEPSPRTPTGGLYGRFIFSTGTGATDPTSGRIKVNNADLALATEMYISGTTRYGSAVDPFFLTWGIKDYLGIFDELLAVGAYYILTGPIVDNGGWYTAPIQAMNGPASTIADAREIMLLEITAPDSRIPRGGTAGQAVVKTGAPDFETGWGNQGHTIQDEGTPVTQRTTLNFTGPGVTVTDDSGNSATVVNVPSASELLILPAIVDSGAIVLANSGVCIRGWDVPSGKPLVAAASAFTASLQPVIGWTTVTAGAGSAVDIVLTGEVAMDTSLFAAGDRLYQYTAGNVGTAPTTISDDDTEVISLGTVMEVGVSGRFYVSIDSFGNRQTKIDEPTADSFAYVRENGNWHRGARVFEAATLPAGMAVGDIWIES